MSFIVVATEVFGAGLAADIAAGAMMGGSITIGSNVLRGKNPFDNIGQGLLLGGLTAGISSGLGNSLSGAGVSTTAAEEAVKQGALKPDLAGPNINSLGNSVEAGAVPAPALAGPNINSLGNSVETSYANAMPTSGFESVSAAPVTATSMPVSDQLYGLPAEQSASVLPSEAANAAPASPAAPSDATTPADFNRNHVSPASDYKGTSPSSGLPSLKQAGQFAKDNWKMLTGIAAIGLLNQPKPTVSGSGQKQGYIRPASYDPYSGKYTYYDPIKTQDYTHARNGGLMGLANGGAVAFADGGTSMTSPYLNAINNPETIPLMSGETQAEGLARMQAQQQELDERNKRRMEAAGQQAPETIEYTQSPAGLNAANPTVQTQADVDYWEQRGAGMAGSGFTTGSGDDSGNAERQNAFIQSLMANNPAAVGPTNAQMMAAQDQERAELAARQKAMIDLYGPGSSVSTGPDGDAQVFNNTTGKLTKVGNSEQQVQALANMPNVPAAGGEPMSNAQGIQTLVKPDVPRPTAQTDGPPITTSGIEQLVHGNIYDPKTGHYRNPTAAEIGAKGIKEARDNINTVSEMTALTKEYFNSYKPGEVLDFAGGTLTKNADGTATHRYTDANGKEQSYTFTKDTDIATIAKSDPAIAVEWKSMFDYNVPTGGTSVTTTPHVSGPSVPTGGTSGTTTPHVSGPSVPTDGTSGTTTPHVSGPSVPTDGTSGTTTPHPTGPVLTPGTGSAGSVTQVPTGFTPPTAPTTRVPTSIEDFNTRFNKQTGDSKAMYDYLMGNGPEPKQTQNAEVMKPYWEAMGTVPVDKTRSEFMYDPTTKKYIKNPDYVKKVFDPVTKRLIAAPSSTSGSGSGSGSGSNANQPPPTETELTNHDSKPKQDPGPGAEWVWIPATKRWVAIGFDDTGGSSAAARGGLMGYAAGGLGSLGGYSDGGRLLRGPGDGVSDSIPASIGNRQPARLADGEFVVPARIVSELGNGSTEAGARRLYQMMDRVQNARRKSIGKNKVATNSRADKYLPA